MQTVESPITIGAHRLSLGEVAELRALGMLTEGGELLPPAGVPAQESVGRYPIEAPDVLNEAYNYTFPAYKMAASFTRGLRIPLGAMTLLLISGTASVDENGKTIHPGDFRAQCWRTYRNITHLLEAEGATWHDIVRCSCYMRDIERDYDEFNEVRNCFFQWLGLNPLPASTGIQARLCREDLLIEIEAIAMIPTDRAKTL